MKWSSTALYLMADIGLIAILVAQPSGDELIRWSVCALFSLGTAIYLNIDDKD